MQMCCNMGGVPVFFEQLRPISCCAVSAQPRKSHVGGVQFEVVDRAHAPRHLAEQVGGQVLDSATAATLGVEVGSFATGQVISGSAVTEMDVLHDPQIAQRNQRPVDARAMHLRGDVGHCSTDLVHGEVARGVGERGQDGPPWRGHPFAFGPKQRGNRGQQRLGVGAGQRPRIHIHKDQPSRATIRQRQGATLSAGRSRAAPEDDSQKPRRRWRAALMAVGVRGDGRSRLTTPSTLDRFRPPYDLGNSPYGCDGLASPRVRAPAWARIQLRHRPMAGVLRDL